MKNLKIKNLSLVTLAIVFSLIPLISHVYAAAPTCAAPAVQTYPSPRDGSTTERRDPVDNEQKQLAAAQMRYEKNHTPPNSFSGGDSEIRSSFSFYFSLLIAFSGLYALVALLYGKFNHQSLPPRRSLHKAFDYALQPSTALSALGLLFVVAIVGSALTSPATRASAHNRRKDANDFQRLAAPTSKPVFSSVETIGGAGDVQIGAPYFDAAGNRYVRGAFSGSLTIGATTLTASRDFDSFFAKYDNQGNALWARQTTGATSGVPDGLAVEGTTALAVDPTGNIYIGGSFVKTVTLQGGTNASVTLTDGGAAGVNYESFIAKYDGGGNLLWVKGGNSGGEKSLTGLQTGQNGIGKIVFDSFGSPYVAGFISGSKFLEKPINDYNFTNQGKSDIVVAKLDSSNGNPLWMQVIGGSGDDNAIDLVIYSTGFNTSSLILAGSFNSPAITFPTSPIATTFNNGSAAINTFFTQFNQDGASSWVKFLGNSDTVGVSQMANADGAIYATGYFKGQLNVATTFGNFNLNNTRTGTGEAALAGYVATVDPTNGDFVRATGLGGVGKALAINPNSSDIYVAGTVWNSGGFSGADTLESLGGNDIYVAAINRFNFEGNWAKTIAGTNYEGLVAVDDTANADNITRNAYNPLGVAYDPGKAKMVISGDYQGILALDCLKLTAPANTIRSYIVEIGGASDCRLWTGRDTNFANWELPDNWNNGIVPSANDSVYINVPSGIRSPILTSASNVPLKDLTIVNRTLTLQRDLLVGERFDLLAGVVNAGSKVVSLGAFAESMSTNGGRVIGKVQKQFFGMGDSFTFPVGTANGYSPVTLSNINAGKGGSFAVVANQGAYPNQADGLPMNRSNRWWNLTNGGLTQADLTFQYVEGDITAGDESQYRAFRIPTGGGTATMIPSSINPATNVVTAPAVTQFSDWTLAQPIPPTAATATVSGRVVNANRRGISGATVTVINAAGQIRTAQTNFLGYYFFDDLPVGETYVFSASSKRYRFNSQAINLNESLSDVNFSPIGY